LFALRRKLLLESFAAQFLALDSEHPYSMSFFRRFIRACLALGALETASAQAPAATLRGVIDGVIADSSLSPVANAEVSVTGSTLRVLSSVAGRFRIIGLPAGKYLLTLRHTAFAPASVPVTVSPGDTVRLSLTLLPATTSTDTAAYRAQLIAARRAEFQQLRTRGTGQFLTEQEIQQRHVTSTSELLRQFSMLRVQGTFVSAAHSSTFRDACPFQLFVNGKPLPAVSVTGLPEPAALLGIAVYASIGAIPPNYQAYRGDHCGAIFTWSRDDS
jgi:hypothetical protein